MVRYFVYAIAIALIGFSLIDSVESVAAKHNANIEMIDG